MTNNCGATERKKLIIHETDCHGCGFIYFNGKSDRYTYDDGCWGDVRCTVEELIKIGFIDPNDVVIFTENEEVYKYVEKGLNCKDD